VKIHLSGQEVELLPEGALWLPQWRALALADLHFEKGSFFGQFSTFLPPYDSTENLRRLKLMIDCFKPDVVVAAGDSFHDSVAAERMKPADLVALDRLLDRVSRWYWLTGNHDPKVPEKIRGRWAEELMLSPIVFRHQLTAMPGPEISGHYHPKIRITFNGHRLSIPCFVQAGERLILPSFGEYTGGLDVNSPAFLKVVPPDGRQIYGLYQDRVFRI